MFLRRKSESIEELPEPIAQPPRTLKADTVTEAPADELAWYEIGNQKLLSKNYDMAVYYLKKALNNMDAIALLAFCTEFGLGTAQDSVKAEKLYVLAAKKSDNGLAIARLAFLRYYGRPFVRIDRVEVSHKLS